MVNLQSKFRQARLYGVNFAYQFLPPEGKDRWQTAHLRLGNGSLVHGGSGFLLVAAAGCYLGNRRLSDSFTPFNSSSALNAKARTPEQMFLFPSLAKDAGDSSDLGPGRVLPTSLLLLPHKSLGLQVPRETDKGQHYAPVLNSCWLRLGALLG